MKLKLEKNIGCWGFTVLCGLWLAGVPLFAQEKPDDETNSVAAPDTSAAPATNEATVNEADSNATAAAESVTKGNGHRVRKGVHRNASVVIGSSSEVKEGENVEAFVVIGGNGVARGKVRDAAVVIGGNLEISGDVGDAAVAVMGNVIVRSNANVKGDVVSVGGKTEIEDGATIGGTVQSVDLGQLGIPHIEPLRKWFVHCALKLRPLSLQVGWVWIVAAIYLLIYLAVAVILPKPVQACVAELTRRPVTTFFMGLLTKLLLPIVFIILSITVVGLIVVPFVIAALLFGAIIGKVALLQYLGDSIRRAIGSAEPLKPAVALLVGAGILTLFYLIPVLGLFTFAVTAVWGLGVATTTAFGSMKRETPEKPTPPSATPASMTQPGNIAPMPIAPGVASPQSFAADVPPTFGETTPTSSTAPAMPGVATAKIPEALAYPRAGFWERMGAAFLDVIIVGILSGFAGNFLHRMVPAYGLFISLAYFAGMWAWKGTTVGGVVLSLKVVRLDGGPVSFLVALVRGLAAALSVIVMFLGFLWIAWDADKQGWHDRIAGTVVVRVPRGTSLVCF